MARSSYIYTVMGAGGPVAAFTVKHELKTWAWQRESIPKTWIVYRMRDGKPDKDYEVVPWMELLE